MDFASLLRSPDLSLRWVPVWRRNLLVWRKLALASVLGNIADPLLYMLALGYGIGAFVPEVGGMKYIAFIGTGMVCQSAMFTSSFEAMYSAFSRMHVQRTWEAIINAPVSLDDVVFAEWIWAASKSVMSVLAILIVILGLGFGHSWLAIWVLPLGFIVGLTMLLLSGVFFPVDQMPAALRAVAVVLPLSHAIDIARPLLAGKVPDGLALHLAVLLAYASCAYYVALVLTRRRLLK
ncbi:MAG: nodulation protein NodJ [Betaproteobacteria bacterium]|nr:MAG: nodulation protein NodJ [Betaproteobacteria bacterium]